MPLIKEKNESPSDIFVVSSINFTWHEFKMDLLQCFMNVHYVPLMSGHKKAVCSICSNVGNDGQTKKSLFKALKPIKSGFPCFGPSPGSWGMSMST